MVGSEKEKRWNGEEQGLRTKLPGRQMMPFRAAGNKHDGVQASKKDSRRHAKSVPRWMRRRRWARPRHGANRRSANRRSANMAQG